jgi:hypothetical protein
LILRAAAHGERTARGLPTLEYGHRFGRLAFRVRSLGRERKRLAVWRHDAPSGQDDFAGALLRILDRVAIDPLQAMVS